MISAAESKTVAIAEKYIRMVKEGKFGCSGSEFLTIRAMAAAENISPVTAQKVFSLLTAQGMVKCFHRKYYITPGRLGENSSLGKVLASHASFSPKPLIGLLMPEPENPFFAALIQRTSHSVITHGCIPVVLSYEKNEASERDMTELFISMGVKGLLACPSSQEAVEKIYANCILPVVFLATKYSDKEDHCSSVDNYSAAKSVAKHFWEMGYGHFLYIGVSKSGDPRYRGYFDQLAAMGIADTDRSAFFIEDRKELPYALVQKIADAKKPLGIFCYHDMLAERVLYACRKHRLRIPEDVGIVGFDDLPVAKQVEPPLSTVAYSFDRIAKHAVEKLLRQIGIAENVAEDDENDIRSMLIVRDSSRRIGKERKGHHDPL